MQRFLRPSAVNAALPRCNHGCHAHRHASTSTQDQGSSEKPIVFTDKQLKTDHYEILQVNSDANRSVLTASRLKLMSLYSSGAESNSARPEHRKVSQKSINDSIRLSTQLAESWKILGNPRIREAYDQQRKEMLAKQEKARHGTEAILEDLRRGSRPQTHQADHAPVAQVKFRSRRSPHAPISPQSFDAAGRQSKVERYRALRQAKGRVKPVRATEHGKRMQEIAARKADLAKDREAKRLAMIKMRMLPQRRRAALLDFRNTVGAIPDLNKLTPEDIMQLEPKLALIEELKAEHSKTRQTLQ